MGIEPIYSPWSRVWLGVARVDITPPVGIYHRMWGAATHDRATGVHRPLSATVMALAPCGADYDQQREVILVTLDHCLLWSAEMAELVARIGSASGTSPHLLVVTFSHTHAAGLMGLERCELPGGELIGPYLAKMADAVAGAVCAAREQALPVDIVYGQGRSSLAAHRDLWDPDADEDGSFVCGYNPRGAADDTLMVARASDQSGRLVATLVNYACHPTTLAWENTLISPDYPGAMRELVESYHSAPCIFLQGAAGDLGPREGYVADPAVADRNGRQLGFAALAALEALPPPGTGLQYAGAVESGARLGSWRYAPAPAAQRELAEVWKCRSSTVPLSYREGLPAIDELERNRSEHAAAETAACAAGDVHLAAHHRAQVEILARQKVRISGLPSGNSFPMPVTVLRLGQAVWVAVESELYQYFQIVLRQRFPQAAVVVITLSGGSRPAYLPTAGTYGRGIYQESVSLLAPGCLEKLTEHVAGEIAACLGR